MSRRLALVALAGLALLGLVAGCKERRAERLAESYSDEAKPSGQASAAARPGPRAPAPVTVGIDSIPVEESYEERAASTITEATLQAKVTELEKELSP
jgi:hypothetical protein